MNVEMAFLDAALPATASNPRFWSLGGGQAAVQGSGLVFS